MQRLSIVIPLTGSVQRMEDSLVSVLENRPANCQIVVVLNEVYADPYDLKNEVRFVYTPIGCGPVECLNRGIDAAEGQIVHVLTAGAEVSSAWSEAAMAHFEDGRVAAVAPLILRSDDPHRVVSAGLEYRRGGASRRSSRGSQLAEIPHQARSTLGPDMLAGFYRKSALGLVDRFCGETGVAYSAVDLALKLRHAGHECVFEPNCRVYAHESLAAGEGVVLQTLQAERLFWRWAPSQGLWGSLPAHAFTVCWHTLAAFPRPAMLGRIVGRFLGLCGIGLHGRHYRQLAQLRDRGESATARVPAPHTPMTSAPDSTGSLLSSAGSECTNSSALQRRLLG
ncbi:MAG: hypothetical protein U9N87_08605 [Planctomycetota bacterium]|nr:hypothetical protein [Planctomycetota bacterium]